jgi:hypothetical protein
MVAITRILKALRRHPVTGLPAPVEREAYLEALEQLRGVDPDLALEAARDLGVRYRSRSRAGSAPIAFDGGS